jgi:transcriptional regulator with XRE-family HTH domain
MGMKNRLEAFMPRPAKRTIIRRSTDQAPLKRSDSVFKPGRNNNLFARDNRDQAFAYIRKLKDEEKLTYEQIAERLTREGWVGPRNNELTQPTLSRFMIRMGYRVFEPHSRPTLEEMELGSPAPSKLSKVERQIMQVFKTTFDTSTRLELAKTLIDKHLQASQDTTESVRVNKKKIRTKK